MSSTQQNPRETLARNLKLLMDRHELDQVKLAKKSGVNQKTISNILNTRNAPNLDKLGAIASAFGLTAWHLIMPDLPAELVNGGSIEKLVRDFVTADQKGRDYIAHVAEREASYKKEAS